MTSLNPSAIRFFFAFAEVYGYPFNIIRHTSTLIEVVGAVQGVSVSNESNSLDSKVEYESKNNLLRRPGIISASRR